MKKHTQKLHYRSFRRSCWSLPAVVLLRFRNSHPPTTSKFNINK